MHIKKGSPMDRLVQTQMQAENLLLGIGFPFLFQ